MVSLEWYRTFKAVYKHKNYSRAAEELFISQPAVSNQIGMLEATIGHKLFTRKSKGVEPTENAKFLNNLIIDALDKLDAVEAFYSKRVAKEAQMFTLGLSPHIYQSLFSGKLAQIGQHISFRFEESSDLLFELVNERKLDYAIIDKTFNTFDTIAHTLLSTPLTLVAHPDVPTDDLAAFIQENNIAGIEKWMENQTWLSHIPTNRYVKLFWLHCFEKRRPRILTNFTIPNEYLMLEELAKIPGVAIALQHNAQSFIEQGKVKHLWTPKNAPVFNFYLIAHKKRQEHFESLSNILKPENGL
ncbi:hypothetical protein BKI52_43900 [marine bacterium AO1-C]|nr:hypothetical protein BKI52_43900 [marine bacterium AO1-C]